MSIEGFHNPRPVGTPRLAPSRRRRSSEWPSIPVQTNPPTVLAPVKERPGDAEPSRTGSLPAVLDRRSPRRPAQGAGRDGKMIAAKPKDAAKKEDKMPPDRIP